MDFDGWQYLSRNSESDPTRINAKKPVVYFGSFQNLLGRDGAGNIKPKNEWLHKVKWYLVVFDEYHFGAWRETAKELFEGEEESVAKKEAKLEYATDLEDVNEDLSELSEKETEFLPIIRTDYFRFLNFDILSYAREVHPRNCILHLRGIIKGYQDGSTLRCHQPNLERDRGGKASQG